MTYVPSIWKSMDINSYQTKTEAVIMLWTLELNLYLHCSVYDPFPATCGWGSSIPQLPTKDPDNCEFCPWRNIFTCRGTAVKVLLSCLVKSSLVNLNLQRGEKRASKQARKTNKQGQQSLIEFPSITELINVRGSSFGELFIIDIDPEGGPFPPSPCQSNYCGPVFFFWKWLR